MEGVRHERDGIPIALDRCVASLEYAKDHVFERVSVAKDYEILTQALRHGRGYIRCGELKRLLRLEESSGLILRKGDEIATVASLKREKEMIDCINRGIGGCSPLGGGKPFNPSVRLNPEQNQVLRFVLDSRDQTVNIRGAAGTGKTATLRELHRALLESGHEVIAVAPTMSAVEELQKVGFGRASTLERLLQDHRAQATLSEKILIVDEAGMVSGRQMWELLNLAERHSARVIFSGDTRQIQSVEACDALRVLERESRLKSIELIQVQRQTVQEYREAIKELRSDPAHGFERLDVIGAIREVPWLDRARAVAQAFAETEQKGQKALVVSATHEEIYRVTEAIRSRRKQNGQLGSSVEIGRNISLNWTTAQKSEMRNFRPGQLLVFHRAVKGIAKNETVEVAQVEKNQIVIRTAPGKSRALTARQAKSFDVCERRAFEVAPGDKLLITANRRTQGFKATNGEIVTVNRIDQHGSIGLEDGRVVPPNFRQFTCGYAVTAHRSQGKSVDEVIISADGMKKELFYVAASRGRESVRIITSDKDMLRDAVAQSNARRSASELARSIRPGLHQGMNRGFAATCRLARWAARYIPRLRKSFALAKHLPHQPVMERTHDWSIG